MASVRVVGMAGPVIDYPLVIGEACRRIGCAVEVDSYPFRLLSEVRPRHVRQWRAALDEAGAGTLTVFVPGQADYFIGGADLSLPFSAYRRWFVDQSTRVIPHPWSSVPALADEDLKWRGKPPLRVGFMGSTYAGSRTGKIIARAPQLFRNWLLRGDYLRSAETYVAALTLGIPMTYAGTFVRSETVAVMERGAAPVGAEFSAFDSNGFDGSAAAIERYAKHLAWSTYVLCPRGIENYSIRVYEALRFGRVPVIIDTDMVLPPEVEWSRVALIVPYAELSRLPERIAEEWHQRSAADFIARQAAAREAMKMLDRGDWLTPLAEEIARRAADKTRPSSPPLAAVA